MAMVYDTPIETCDVPGIGPIWLKRDDLYAGLGGVYGGKARVMEFLALDAVLAHKTGVVAAVARNSSIPNVVARIAKAHGLDCHLHTALAGGNWRSEGEWALAADAGADITEHYPGHMTVIAARARDDADRNVFHLIPFGLATHRTVSATAGAVDIFPDGVKRLVVPVGSGAMLAGILAGLRYTGQQDIPVLGVMLGGDPRKCLYTFAPSSWPQDVQLVPARQGFKTAVDGRIGGLILDPYYEAKCLPFLQAGDCLWIVALRSSLGVPTCVGR